MYAFLVSFPIVSTYLQGYTAYIAEDGILKYLIGLHVIEQAILTSYLPCVTETAINCSAVTSAGSIYCHLYWCMCFVELYYQ